MVGITLSSEQVRTAPPEVRRWLEQELLASFGWQLPAAEPNAPQLVACSVEDALKVLALIKDMIPVANVFFELGHEGASVGTEGIEAFRLVDILRHARLANTQQVEASLQVINDAVRRVRGDANATFYGLDDRGYCFIAEETQRSISTVWNEIVSPRNAESSSRQPEAGAAVPSGEAPQPYSSMWTAQARPAELTNPAASGLEASTH